MFSCPRKIPAVKSKFEAKVVVKWRPIAKEPSPLWRKLWARLVINKKGKPPYQAPAEDTLTGGAEEDKFQNGTH